MPTMRVMVTLQVGGGRSNRGRTQMAEEIEERVLRPFKFQRQDGWDYLLIVPYESAADLDLTMSQLIPTKARLIAARLRCTVEYSARSLDEPQRTWTLPIPPAPPETRRTELTLELFPRRRWKQVIAAIEAQVLRRFPLEKPHDKKPEYRLTVLHKTDEELQSIAARMLDDAKAIAHEGQANIPFNLFHSQFEWSGSLK